MEGKKEMVRQDILDLPWEWARDKIYPCLAPRRWKGINDQKVVTRTFLDLSVYYYIQMISGDDMISIWINRKIMEQWGISRTELDTRALENLVKDVRIIQDEDEVPEAGTHLPEFCIMTKKDGLYGAAGILDERSLAGHAAERGTDLYIIPSSIHEVLLLPATDAVDEKALNKMIRDMNQMFVTPEERLADYAYLYERTTRMIRIVW